MRDHCSSPHHQMASSASAQGEMNAAFLGAHPSLDAWSLASLQEATGIDKQLLTQALMSQASNALMNNELFNNVNKEKLYDSLMRLSEKSQQDKEGGASGPGPNNHGFMQPIRVTTQSGGSSLYHGGGAAASMPGWSNPGTPNSIADSAPSSSCDTQSTQAPNQRLHMFPQKSFPNKFSPPNLHTNNSPVSAAFDQRPGSNTNFQCNTPQGGGFRGRPVPFQYPRQRHISESSGDGKSGAERFQQGPGPEQFGSMDHGAPFPNDFPGLHAHRSHFIEEFLPPEYAGLPFPPHLNYPHSFPPHLHAVPPDGYEYYPQYDPYFQGRIGPSFFGPNEMFFDMFPPHFYGLPHFFPGFKPPR